MDCRVHVTTAAGRSDWVIAALVVVMKAETFRAGANARSTWEDLSRVGTED